MIENCTQISNIMTANKAYNHQAAIRSTAEIHAKYFTDVRRQQQLCIIITSTLDNSHIKRMNFNKDTKDTNTTNKPNWDRDTIR